jgi:hypothetical protein
MACEAALPRVDHDEHWSALWAADGHGASSRPARAIDEDAHDRDYRRFVCRTAPPSA